MEITLVQTLLIGLVTAFCYAGQLLGIYTNRSLVMAFLVGVILGDIPTALVMGGIAELAFMGFGVGAGGTVPPNPVGPGIVGTIMTITLKDQGVTPEAALSLSFPFAVLFQFVTTGIYTIMAGTPKIINEAIDNGNWRKVNLVSNSTILVMAIAGFVIGVSASVSLPALESFVNIIPEWVIKGFAVAGGLIPAMGFAMILSVMLDKNTIPYVILGYISVAYLQLPTMGVALLGLVFALIYYFNSTKKNSTDEMSAKFEEDYSDGI